MQCHLKMHFFCLYGLTFFKAKKLSCTTLSPLSAVIGVRQWILWNRMQFTPLQFLDFKCNWHIYLQTIGKCVTLFGENYGHWLFLCKEVNILTRNLKMIPERKFLGQNFFAGVIFFLGLKGRVSTSPALKVRNFRQR